MIDMLGTAVEAATVICFLSLLTAIELLRADGGSLARHWLERLRRPALAVGLAFAVVIARRFYVLAT